MSAENGTSSAGGRSLWADAWAQLKGDRIAMVCLAIIVVFALTAVYGEVVYWRYNVMDATAPKFMAPVQKMFIKVLGAGKVVGQIAPYQKQDLDFQYQAPGWSRVKGTDGKQKEQFHLMGTDGLGRDVFQRVIQGVRIAFQVGIITSLIAIPIAVFFGCLAGYFGGWIDDIVVWLYSTVASMPALLFILAISMVVGKGLVGVYLGIGLTTWTYLCRLIRGEVLKHKEQTYVKAALVAGLGPGRIIFRHILPNVFHIIIINFSLRFPAAIETEVIMSFLGIGVQNQPSWGIMISNARFRLWYGVWWELTFTTLAIFLIVLAFNLFGDALRDALDPRLRKQTERS
jgi:peptide/nickel transport system permease protein